MGSAWAYWGDGSGCVKDSVSEVSFFQARPRRCSILRWGFWSCGWIHIFFRCGGGNDRSPPCGGLGTALCLWPLLRRRPPPRGAAAFPPEGGNRSGWNIPTCGTYAGGGKLAFKWWEFVIMRRCICKHPVLLKRGRLLMCFFTFTV